MIAFSMACQPIPLRQPTIAATAAPNSRAIWLGPELASSPYKNTENDNSATRVSTGSSACRTDGVLRRPAPSPELSESFMSNSNSERQAYWHSLA